MGRNYVDACARDRQLMEAMRLWLVHETVPALRILAVVSVVALILAVPAMLRHARRVPLATACIALVITNLALALRLWWVQPMPQVYFDEMLFLNTSQTMATDGLHALSTFDGKPPGPLAHACPGGWQFLVSLVYRGLGQHVNLAFVLAACLSAFTVLLLFLATWEMFGDGRVALCAAILLAVLPIHLRLAGSAALETSSMFFLVAALAAILAWIRGGERTLLLLGACCLGWLANIRMEGPVVLLPVLCLLLLPLVPSERARTWGNALTLLLAGVVVCLAMAPSLLADFYGLANHTFVYYQSVEQTRLQVRSNMSGNLWFWVADRIHPLSLTVLALVGLAWCRREHRRLAFTWMAWFVIVVGFYTMNPSCDFSLRFTLDSWRNALHPSLAVVILAALGADALLRHTRGIRSTQVLAGLVVLVAMATPWFFKGFILDRHVWMENWAALTAMRPLVQPGERVLMADRSLPYGPSTLTEAYELVVTTGAMPRIVLLPEDYRGEAGQLLPQIMIDVEAWLRDQGRPLLLYHLHLGTESEAHQFSVLQSMLDLEPAAGTAMRRSRITYGMWRIKGVHRPTR